MIKMIIILKYSSKYKMGNCIEFNKSETTNVLNIQMKNIDTHDQDNVEKVHDEICNIPNRKSSISHNRLFSRKAPERKYSVGYSEKSQNVFASSSSLRSVFEIRRNSISATNIVSSKKIVPYDDRRFSSSSNQVETFDSKKRTSVINMENISCIDYSNYNLK
jgi:hypothetical protein